MSHNIANSPLMFEVPNEILTDIFRHIAHWRFSGISLASRRFHDLAIPYKFQTLCFTSIPSPDLSEAYGHGDTSWTEPRSVRFCRALNNSDEQALAIAPYVEKCIIKYWDRRTMDTENGLIQCFKAFAALPNLAALAVINSVTHPSVLELLGQLEQLHSLQLTNCFLSGSYTFDSFSNLKMVTSLVCSSGPYDEMVTRFIPKTNIKILKSANWGLTKDVLEAEPPIQLKELWISSPIGHPDLLWSYLTSTTASSLTHLSLMKTPVGGDCTPPQDIALDLPRLQYLRASVRSAVPFSDQPMKELDIVIVSYENSRIAEVMKGIVFPHVEHLAFSLPLSKLLLPDEFLRESFPRLRSLEAKLPSSFHDIIDE